MLPMSHCTLYKYWKIEKGLRVAGSTISGLVNKKSNASPALTMNIAQYFNVREEWLRDGTGEKYSQPDGSAVSEPQIPYKAEPKKTVYHPLKLAIDGYVDEMNDDELLELVNRLSIAAQKREKS